MAGVPQPLMLDLSEVIETPRLRLRATRAGDGRAANEALVESHAELRPWMPWAREAQTPEQSEQHCRDMQAQWHERRTLDFCFFTRDGGGFVGKGGLHTIDWSIPKFEIGYWVRTSAAGRGFATEATKAMVEWARAFGARRFEITSDARNVASRRVAEKSGFELEGILRRSRRDNAGELSDSCMYARIF